MEPRKRKRLLLAFAGVVAFVAGLWYFPNRNTEPSYQGRPLSEWIGVYADPFTSQRPRAQAAEAIRAIGTDGLPFLLEWLSYEPGPWRRTFDNKVPNLHRWVRRSGVAKPVLDRWLYQSGNQAWHSVRAFESLGSLATPAISELQRGAEQATNPDVRDRAFHALGYIGPAAVPAFSNVLANAHPTNAVRGYLFISQLGTDAAPLVPLLASQLQHPDDLVVWVCANTLGEILLRPDHAVPALVEAMNDPRPYVRLSAMDALARFGPLAESALFALTNALNDPNPQVRANAATTIKAITGVAPP